MSEKEPKILSKKDLNASLPKEVSERFEILMDRRTSPRFRTKEGTFDLTTLSIRQCEALVKQKASWIKEKTKSSPPATK